MKNMFIFSLLLCLIPSFLPAMEQNPATTLSTVQTINPVVSSIDPIVSAGQSQTMFSPRKNGISTADQNSEATQDEYAQKLIYAYKNSDNFLKSYFPALFDSQYKESYPMGISNTEGLQIAVVFNNLAKVKNYLFLLELGQADAFSQPVTAQLHKQIEKIEQVIYTFTRDAITGELINDRTVDENITFLKEVQELLDLNQIIATVIRPEIKFLTGPAAPHAPLSDLCGSPTFKNADGPKTIEDTSYIQKVFKNKLVIGLCGILVQAHVLKAQSMSPETQAQYLKDMGEINTLMWESYEKKPNLYDQFIGLHDSLLSIEEKLNKNIKKQVKQIKQQNRAHKKENIIVL